MSIATRQIVKAELQGGGWVRMHRRPRDRQVIVVAKEWVDRRFGQTDQFLTSAAIYDAKTDTVELCCMETLVRTVPAKSLHWWMDTSDPTAYRVADLFAANWLRAGMRGAFMHS